MSKSEGFTLVELLVAVAIIAMLLAMLVPSLSSARQKAKLTTCLGTIRVCSTSLAGYAGSHDGCLPPFAFSDYSGDLPLSGHWGGAGEQGDPTGFGRRGVDDVNLQVLVEQEYLDPTRMWCPASSLRSDGSASRFPHTRRFSSYCLRLPASEDLFDRAPGLAWRGGKLLGIFAQAAGGQRIRVGSAYQRVPRVRLHQLYRLQGSGEDSRSFLPVRDTLLADPFWQRAGDDGRYRVRRGLCHGPWLNAARGDGSAGSFRVPPAGPADLLGSVEDDGQHYATFARTMWTWLDEHR